MTNRKVIACILAALVTTGCSASMTDEEHIQDAKNYLDSGEFSAASIALKNALLQSPDSLEARWLLGKVYWEMGNLPAAEKELTLARKLGVSDEAVLPLLAQALAGQNKNEEVLELETSGLSPAVLAEVLALQGSALITLNQLDDAEDKINQALSADPESATARSEEARLVFSRGDYVQAREKLENLLETNSTDARAWSLLGDLERIDKQPEKAETAYSNAIEYQPAKSELDTLKRALVRIDLQKFDSAQEDIDSFIKRYPNNFEVNYAQGLVHLHYQRIALAQQSFDISVNQNSQFLPALFYRGLTNYMLGDKKQADRDLTHFVSLNPGAIPGRSLLARIRLEDGKFVEAEELIRPVVNTNEEDVAALMLLSKALIGQGRVDEGVEMLEKLTALQPESAGAHLALGSGLILSGDYEASVEHLEKSIELDPQLQRGDLMLIQHYLQQQQLDKALETALSYRDRHADIAQPYNTLGVVYLKRLENKQAEQAFHKALELEPGHPAASNNLAEMAIKAKDYDTAQKYYDEVLKHNENNLNTLLYLVALDELRADESAMVKHIEQAIAAHPEALQPRILLARHYLVEGKPEQVVVALGEPGQQQRNNPDVLGLSALAQLQQGEYTAARSSLERLVETAPNLAKAHFLLAMAYKGLKNDARVKIELEKALELDPEHYTARLALTRLLLIEGQPDNANKQLIVLKEMAPDNPDVLRLEAVLSKEQGQQQRALDIYEDIFNESASKTSMLDLARQNWETGNQEESLKIQENWVAEHPEDITAKITLANTYEKQGRTDKAIELYQQVLRKDENNLVALNNLAWALRDSDPKQALEYATKASKLAPESGSLADTLAVVLFKNGDLELAQRKIERALAYSPDEPSIRYHSAMIKEAAGYKAESIETLTTLLSEDNDFPEKAEASRLLERLQSGG